MKTKVNIKKKVSTEPKSEPLKQGDVSGLVCEHYYRYLETTEKGLQCKKCMTLLNEQTLR